MRALVIAALLAAAATPGNPEAAAGDAAFALDALEKKAGHFFRPKGVDWKKVRAEIARAAAKADSTDAHYAILVRLAARLRDGHAAVIPKEGAKDAKWPGPALERGPGMFWCVADGRVLVKNAWGAAEAAGVKAGMEIVAADGLPARKWLDRRIEELSDTHGFSTRQQAEYFACHWGLAGPAGSSLAIEFRGPDGKSATATLERGDGGVVARGPAFPPEGTQPVDRQSWGRTPKGFGYIHLRDTPESLPAQVDTMLAGIGEAAGLVLDFRGNGGGAFDHAALLGRFVPKGKRIAFTEAYASAGERPFAGPVVVIVDAGVRSAGETGSGIFKEDGRAYMIGESPTAGMSSSKQVLDLPSGLFSIRFSVDSNMNRFNGGKGVEGIGVQPHEVVPYDAKDLAAGVDTLIRRAEALLEKFPQGKVPYKPPR